jgi:hypothetical protein
MSRLNQLIDALKRIQIPGARSFDTIFSNADAVVRQIGEFAEIAKAAKLNAGLMTPEEIFTSGNMQVQLDSLKQSAAGIDAAKHLDVMARAADMNKLAEKFAYLNNADRMKEVAKTVNQDELLGYLTYVKTFDEAMSFDAFMKQLPTEVKAKAGYYNNMNIEDFLKLDEIEDLKRLANDNIGGLPDNFENILTDSPLTKTFNDRVTEFVEYFDFAKNKGTVSEAKLNEKLQKISKAKNGDPNKTLNDIYSELETLDNDINTLFMNGTITNDEAVTLTIKSINEGNPQRLKELAQPQSSIAIEAINGINSNGWDAIKKFDEREMGQLISDLGRNAYTELNTTKFFRNMDDAGKESLGKALKKARNKLDPEDLKKVLREMNNTPLGKLKRYTIFIGLGVGILYLGLGLVDMIRCKIEGCDKKMGRWEKCRKRCGNFNDFVILSLSNENSNKEITSKIFKSRKERQDVVKINGSDIHLSFHDYYSSHAAVPENFDDNERNVPDTKLIDMVKHISLLNHGQKKFLSIIENKIKIEIVNTEKDAHLDHCLIILKQGRVGDKLSDSLDTWWKDWMGAYFNKEEIEKVTEKNDEYMVAELFLLFVMYLVAKYEYIKEMTAIEQKTMPKLCVNSEANDLKLYQYADYTNVHKIEDLKYDWEKYALNIKDEYNGPSPSGVEIDTDSYKWCLGVDPNDYDEGYCYTEDACGKPPNFDSWFGDSPLLNGSTDFWKKVVDDFDVADCAAAVDDAVEDAVNGAAAAASCAGLSAMNAKSSNIAKSMIKCLPPVDLSHLLNLDKYLPDLSSVKSIARISAAIIVTVIILIIILFVAMKDMSGGAKSGIIGVFVLLLGGCGYWIYYEIQRHRREFGDLTKYSVKDFLQKVRESDSMVEGPYLTYSMMYVDRESDIELIEKEYSDSKVFVIEQNLEKVFDDIDEDDVTDDYEFDATGETWLIKEIMDNYYVMVSKVAYMNFGITLAEMIEKYGLDNIIGEDLGISPTNDSVQAPAPALAPAPAPAVEVFTNDIM